MRWVSAWHGYRRRVIHIGFWSGNLEQRPHGRTRQCRCDLKEIGKESMDWSSGSGQGQVVVSCEHGNELSSYIECR